MGAVLAAWPTGRMTSTLRPAPSHLSPSEVARLTPADRNRAVDLYRALAMIVVAVGHWLGMVVVLAPRRARRRQPARLLARVRVDHLDRPGHAAVLLRGRVRVGHVAALGGATGVRPADWVVHPAAPHGDARRGARRVLGRRPRDRARSSAGFGVAAARRGRRGDPALVPRQLHDRHGPRAVHLPLVPGPPAAARRRAASALFALGEVASFAGVPVLGQLNWVVGWLGFQVAGFAWQHGRLPTGRRLAALAGAALGGWRSPPCTSARGRR